MYAAARRASTAIPEKAQKSDRWAKQVCADVGAMTNGARGWSGKRNDRCSSGSSAAALAIGRGRGCLRLFRRIGEPPAAGTAGEAAVLLLGGFGRGIHQAKDLIQRLTLIGIALGKPALAIMGAGLPVTTPVQALTGILSNVEIHNNRGADVLPPEAWRGSAALLSLMILPDMWQRLKELPRAAAI